MLASVLAPVAILAALTATAAACEGGGGGQELTTLTTSLSGEGKEGQSITVLEGSKVKDKATLSGKNASKATGKVTYAVYSESACKTLVTSAGEVSVSGESVPASSEETLEGGRTYYWQAHYSGDTNNGESTSACNEIATVVAKTLLSTALSGEGKEAEELTVLEGSKVKDKATLMGTNFSTATGKALYKIYSEKECKTLVKEAGEVTLEAGAKIPASAEEELEGGKAYYWQAIYKGDSLHQESTSPCTEVLNVKAKTSLSLKLSGEGSEAEEITIFGGSGAKGIATLSGTNSSTAGGKVAYDVYSDNKCEHLFTEVGEVAVSSGKVPASSEEELEGNATYYWQATYKGDSLHQESKSTCGKAVLNVNPLCTKPYCEPTITPGVNIKIEIPAAPEKECTAGPILKKGTELFVLTAGHCFFEDVDDVGEGNVTKAVKSKYPNKVGEKELGSTGTYTNTEKYDVAEVKIKNAEWLLKGGGLPPVLVEWGTAPVISVVRGKDANKVGEVTCLTGAETGRHCGVILQTGVTAFESKTKNLIETTAAGTEAGDSGAPEYAPEGVLIQGIYLGKGKPAIFEEGKVTNGSEKITELPAKVEGGRTTCGVIKSDKEKWASGVPIEGEGIPPKTTVKGCSEAGEKATVEMSAKATKEGTDVSITIGYKEVGFYEPITQIETNYPGQELLAK